MNTAGVHVVGVTKSFGEVEVLHGVSLSISAGRMLALLGPSGCGKTTLLRIIAGLEQPDAGTVLVGEHVLSDGRNVVPPERRHVGMVFQDWALFPHLSVAANVGYGLRKLPAAETRERVADALAMVGLGHLGDRSPETLSGGQQQRIALARAIAPRPSVLLLDEPFSNLDAALRGQVRTEVHQLLAELGITTLFVTHDQEEAFVLGDDVAVVREGRIVQQAAPTAVYARPADRWVAEFVGDANLMPGHADGRLATTVLGPVTLEESIAGPVDVLVRPESLAIALDPSGDAQVELVEFYGHDTVSLVRLAGDEIIRVRTPGAPVARRDDRVRLTYSGAGAVAYPRTP
ncbi:ABC transporter ATP-binding protein [Phytoactinopolyspora mesophila]|uniref:ABC-type quaternary amine transporter n=1 Tax=Phytoactinopolyspora mesophila TaxID=2650750 RepID=A0A7K3M0M3_9ACTN|nr:ABC transporter ATP-binding protein [Phytoactinopolyspora mesophila]NDL55998.1 ATP-binding cassette domain-containing protein [Phytoactinopolyspora mesophila]